MKKALSSILVTALLCSGCSNTATNTETNNPSPSQTQEESLHIVATIFPEYDWLREIIGDNEHIQLSLLLDDGVDLHSFQPTMEDIVTISTADLLIHVGGVSDTWVESAVSDAVNSNIVVLNEIEILGDSVKMEETVEGMEGTHDHDHAHEEDHDHAHEEEEHDHDHEEEEHDHAHEEDDHDHAHEEEQEDYIPHGEEGHVHDESCSEHEHSHEDEHVWLSLRHAQVVCTALADNLSQLAPSYADSFAENLEAYLQELEALDEKYQEVVADASQNTILVADRFPFRYLVDDYGIHYYAAFSGCSAETEASFATIRFLAEKLDELGLDTILTMENPSHNIPQTVIDNSSAKNQSILVLDSMQSTSKKDAENGVTYLSVMEKNLEVLKEVLQ